MCLLLVRCDKTRILRLHHRDNIIITTTSTRKLQVTDEFGSCPTPRADLINLHTKSACQPYTAHHTLNKNIDTYGSASGTHYRCETCKERGPADNAKSMIHLREALSVRKPLWTRMGCTLRRSSYTSSQTTAGPCNEEACKAGLKDELRSSSEWG